MEFPSDYIQIIVAAIYAIALFYTIVTFQRSKRLDQITSLGDVMKELTRRGSGTGKNTFRISV